MAITYTVDDKCQVLYFIKLFTFIKFRTFSFKQNS